MVKLTDAELEFVYDWTSDDPQVRARMAQDLEQIVADRLAAEQERSDDLRAKVARAEALAEKWEHPADMWDQDPYYAVELRAALDGNDETDRGGRHPVPTNEEMLRYEGARGDRLDPDA